MTIESWKRTALPTPATEPKTDLESARHSLNKWLQFREEVLKRHGLKVVRGSLLNDDGSYGSFFPDWKTCALCQQNDGWTDNCRTCPLARMLNAPCDVGDDSPYSHWTERNDPEPMILALQNLVTRLENEENYKNNREPAW